MTPDLDAQGLGVDVRAERGHTVVTISGELDLYTGEELRALLVGQCAAGRHRLVLDVTAMTFVDSSGLGIMVGAAKRARDAQGTVCLAGPDARTVRLLQLTGLNKIFPTFADPAAALDHLDRMTR